VDVPIGLADARRACDGEARRRANCTAARAGSGRGTGSLPLSAALRFGAGKGACFPAGGEERDEKGLAMEIRF